MFIHVQSSVEAETSRAVENLLAKTAAALDGTKPDLIFLFATHHHEKHFATLCGAIQNRLQPRHIIGCTAETIIDGGQEFEELPGIVIWVLCDSDLWLEPFHVQFERNGEQIHCYNLPEANTDPQPGEAIFLFCEPYSSVPQLALQLLSKSHPGLPVFGGVASGGFGPGENCLFLDGERIEHGAVGLHYRGSSPLRAIVSQGCRPIGHTFVVTKSDKNIVYELGGRPAMERFREMFEELSEEDQELVRQGPHLGLVTDEYKEHFERGDFLVFNVLGSEADTGAIAVSQPVRTGKTIQFHVRDAKTAQEDLQMLIAYDLEKHPAPIRSALIFSCNGRGEKLFGFKDHDAAALERAYGSIPAAGYFAQGEIGPLGKRSYLHGFTASIAIFE